MRLKNKIPGLFFLVFSFVFIFSDIYSNSFEKNKPIPENIISIKLNQFDSGAGISETRYDKLKSRTFYEKVNILLSKKERYIPEVLNNSLLKGVVVDDFQVNDDNNPGTFFQMAVDVDLNKSGMGVACWMDDRNGDIDVYAQRFDSNKNPLGKNFKVNDDLSTAYQGHPNVCVFNDGSFVICWIDLRNGNNDFDIYAQRFNSNGQPVGSNFRVNDDPAGAEQLHPAIDGAGDGFFVICWKDSRIYGNEGDIYAQRYDITGTAIDSNIAVNLGVNQELTQEHPDIAVQDNHAFIVCWEHYHYIDILATARNIFMQIFSETGDRRSFENIQVNETGDNRQSKPKVSVSDSGFCVICWIDERIDSTSPDIYARLLSINIMGGFIGSNFKVNSDILEGIIQAYPAVSITNDTTYVISWVDFGNEVEDMDIYYQVFKKFSRILSNDLICNDNNAEVVDFHPAVGIDSSGSFIICWEDTRNGDSDIFFQKFNNNVSAGENIKINDDTGANQSKPKISVSTDGSFVITFDDRRNGESDIDIYLQKYNSSYAAQGGNVRANDDDTEFFQTYSGVSFLNDTNFAVCWGDHRNGVYNPDIYYQMFKNAGETIGQNVRVNDEQIDAFQLGPDMKSFSDGGFIICWSDDRSGNYDDDIYAQRYNFSGTPVGANFLISDDQSGLSQFFPAVGVSSNGSHGFCWQDMRNYFFDIYAQTYDNSYNKVNNNFKINDDMFISHSMPDIDFASDGTFVVCWADKRNGDDDPDIYAQRYSSNSIAIGDNFRVNDDNSGAAQANPGISAADDGRFVICWKDERNGSNNPDIYAQCYDKNGNPISENIKVNSDQTLKAQSEPDVAMDKNNNIYFVWKDNRNQGQGYDIFAKIISWDVFTSISDDEISEDIPDKYILYQNYPNPFNPVTTIKYSIPKDNKVTIKIYSINGILIKTLVNETQSAGFYTIDWNGENEYGIITSSGLYFINMKAGGYNLTKKMVFLR